MAQRRESLRHISALVCFNYRFSFQIIEILGVLQGDLLRCFEGWLPHGGRRAEGCGAGLGGGASGTPRLGRAFQVVVRLDRPGAESVFLSEL